MENTWHQDLPTIYRHRTPRLSFLARRYASHEPFDAPLFFVTLFLTGAGICMMFSASYAMGIARFGSFQHYVWKQMLFAVIGIVLMGLTSVVNLKWVRRCAGLSLWLTLLLLALVLWTPLGVTMGGARRWLNTRPFLFEPSELAKLTLVVFLAYVFSRPRQDTHWYSHPLVPASIGTFLMIFLIYPQPHLSAVVLLLGVAVIICLLAGVPRRVLITGALLMPLLLAIGWHKAEDYQRERVASWIRAVVAGKVDPKGAEYQICESVKAFMRGGWTGTGFCEGRQKLLYLPAAHTDFIFSVIGEELGLVGTLFTVSLYLLFLWRGLHIAYNALDQFCCLLAAGLTVMVTMQAFIHMGVATHALPTTGMSLPFISYGGSALMMNLAMVGFILNVSRYPDIRTGTDYHETVARRRRHRRPYLPRPRDRRSRTIGYSAP